tara:strand:- start:112390 stop:112623 length:234 start_codon:yes stop_codon:yes gene_type:complete
MLELQNASVSAAETILEETFQTPLSKDWFGGLGTWTVKNPAIHETKQNFGFGRYSGVAAGEKAGAIEFRKLKIKADK